MYDILTYISKEYNDVLLDNIKSWQKLGVNQIHVFTDINNDIIINRSNIHVHKVFDDKQFFGVNCKRKAESLGLYLKEKNASQRVLLIDADCLILKDLNYVFYYGKNVIVTADKNQKDKHIHKTVSSGVVFLNINDETKKFVEEWIKDQNSNFRYSSSQDQISLINTIKKYKDIVTFLDYKRYNYYPINNTLKYINMWVEDILDNHAEIRIIHLTHKVINNNPGHIAKIRKAINE